jgi:hypothetical protein
MPKRPVKKPREVQTPRWAVILHRHKAERLGTVKAKTDKDALEEAFKEYNIEPYNRFRVAVRRET